MEGIFNSELEQFKVTSEKILSDPHALYQEQIQLLKKACRTKYINDCKTFRNNRKI